VDAIVAGAGGGGGAGSTICPTNPWNPATTGPLGD